MKNTGLRAGDEVVQLYVHDMLASVARPMMQLEGFTRVHLAPGEERDVTFTLSRGAVADARPRHAVGSSSRGHFA